MLVFVLNSRNNSLGTSFHMFSKAVIVRAFKEAHQRLDLSVQIDPFRRGLAMNEVSLMLFSYCIQRPVYSLKPISCLFNNQD